MNAPFRHFTHRGGLVLLIAAILSTSQLSTAAQTAVPAVSSAVTRVTVMVPREDAELTVDGTLVPGSGPSRAGWVSGP